MRRVYYLERMTKEYTRVYFAPKIVYVCCILLLAIVRAIADGQACVVRATAYGAQPTDLVVLSTKGRARILYRFQAREYLSKALQSPLVAGVKHVALVTSNGKSDTVRIIPVAGGKVLSLVPSGRVDRILWSPDGTRLAIEFSENSGQRMEVFGVTGKKQLNFRLPADTQLWGFLGKSLYVGIGTMPYTIRSIPSRQTLMSWNTNGADVMFPPLQVKSSGFIIAMSEGDIWLGVKSKMVKVYKTGSMAIDPELSFSPSGNQVAIHSAVFSDSQQTEISHGLGVFVPATRIWKSIGPHWIDGLYDRSHALLGWADEDHVVMLARNPDGLRVETYGVRSGLQSSISYSEKAIAWCWVR